MKKACLLVTLRSPQTTAPTMQMVSFERPWMHQGVFMMLRVLTYCARVIKYWRILSNKNSINKN